MKTPDEASAKLREKAEKLYVEIYSYKHPEQDERIVQLYQEAFKEVREEALEEAALKADKLIKQYQIEGEAVWYEWCEPKITTARVTANAIRALKSKEKPCLCHGASRGEHCLDFHPKGQR